MRNSPYLDLPLRTEAEVVDLAHARYLRELKRIRDARPAQIHDRPLAAPGFTSYRARGRFGFIMIGAKDHADALNEAKRSADSVTMADLEVWDGARYVKVTQ
jgi:hypothetical protein